MKFKCKKEELKNILDVVSKSVNKNVKDGLSGSNGLHFCVDNNNLIVQSTDNVISVDAKLNLSGECTSGECVATPDIVQYIKNCPEGTILLEKKENILCIKSQKKSIGKFNLIDAEFPMLKTGDVVAQIAIDSKELKKSIKRVTIASAVNEESRVVLNGTYFDFNGDMLTMVALDGYRICKQNIKFSSEKSVENVGFIVPTEKLLEIEKLITEEITNVIFTGNHVIFAINQNIIATIKLLQGEYMPYSKIIGGMEKQFSMNVLAEDLMGAVIRNSIISAKNNTSVIKFTLESSKGDDILKITGNSSQATTEDLVAVSLEGNIPDKFQIAFNANYIKDLMKSLDGIEEAKISFSSSIAPGIWEIEDINYMGVILPVKLEN